MIKSFVVFMEKNHPMIGLNRLYFYFHASMKKMTLPHPLLEKQLSMRHVVKQQRATPYSHASL